VPHISEKSRRLALQKRPHNGGHQPVHIRLYHQELEKTQIALRKQHELELEQQELLRKQLMRQA
jgi:hypothetical protein